MECVCGCWAQMSNEAAGVLWLGDQRCGGRATPSAQGFSPGYRDRYPSRPCKVPTESRRANPHVLLFQSARTGLANAGLKLVRQHRRAKRGVLSV